MSQAQIRRPGTVTQSRTRHRGPEVEAAV